MSLVAQVPHRKGYQKQTISNKPRPNLVIPIGAHTKRPPPIRLPPIDTERSISEQISMVNELRASSFPMQKQYPKTPTTHLIEPLTTLISRCLPQPIFQIVEKKTPDLLLPANEGEANAKDLNAILKVLRSKGFKMIITCNDYAELFKMLEKYLFKPNQHIPLVNPFAEVIPVFEITNWVHMEIAHIIFQTILLEPMFISKFITRNFLTVLIDQLDTPVTAEQTHLETEIMLIIENFREKAQFIIWSLISRIHEYQSGSKTSYCVAPIIRICLKYFENHKDFNKISSIYKNYVVPLYAAEHLPDFEKALRSLSSFCIKADPTCSEYCLNYIIKHWPITTSKKELIFLQQLSMLLQVIEEDNLAQFTMKILQILAQSISSVNSSISMNALFLLCDGNFLYHFRTVREQFPLILVPALRIASNHWKEDQKSMAKSLLETLGDDNTIPDVDEKKIKERNETWKLISRQAKLPLYE